MKSLILATQNLGKLQEIRHMLGPEVAVTSLADLSGAPQIVEDGGTFEANAVKKARVVARHANRPALADDSGLEVDALGGAPGVFSARYAGENASDSENNARLVEQLDGVPKEKRTARFRCVIAVATPDGAVRTVEGQCEGRILTVSRGLNGFGYDPLFLVPELGRTFAELSSKEKNRLSHRGQALRAARTILQEIL